MSDGTQVADICLSVDASERRKRDFLHEWESCWSVLKPEGIVIYDLQYSEPRPVGVMIGATVSPQCFVIAKGQFRPSLVLQMVECIEAGRASKPTEQEIGRAHASEGVPLLMCYFSWDAELDEQAAAFVRGNLAQAFLERHGGYRYSQIFGQASGRCVPIATSHGARSIQQTIPTTENLDRFHLMSVTKEDGLASGNMWLHQIFRYFPPQFHFTSAQRSILLLAREGYSDQEIAEVLGTSTDAIKKRWAGMYAKVQAVQPQLLPVSPKNGRGREKKRALINYLRMRPEETRPYSRSTRLAKS